MKIRIEIPNWCESENIYLLTRDELIAYRMAGSEWKIKKHRCIRCGRCCMKHPRNGAYFKIKKDGTCPHLKVDGTKHVCVMGMEKPLACVVGEPTGAERQTFKCAIEY